MADLWLPHLQEQSVCSLLAVDGAESSTESSSGVVVPDPVRFPVATGDDTDIALRKSM